MSSVQGRGGGAQRERHTSKDRAQPAGAAAQKGTEHRLPSALYSGSGARCDLLMGRVRGRAETKIILACGAGKGGRKGEGGGKEECRKECRTTCLGVVGVDAKEVHEVEGRGEYVKQDVPAGARPGGRAGQGRQMCDWVGCGAIPGGQGRSPVAAAVAAGPARPCRGYSGARACGSGAGAAQALPPAREERGGNRPRGVTNPLICPPAWPLTRCCSAGAAHSQTERKRGRLEKCYTLQTHPPTHPMLLSRSTGMAMSTARVRKRGLLF